MFIKWNYGKGLMVLRSLPLKTTLYKLQNLEFFHKTLGNTGGITQKIALRRMLFPERKFGRSCFLRKPWRNHQKHPKTLQKYMKTPERQKNVPENHWSKIFRCQNGPYKMIWNGINASVLTYGDYDHHFIITQPHTRPAGNPSHHLGCL